MGNIHEVNTFSPDKYTVNMRRGFAVLNAEDPVGQVKTLLTAINDQQTITLTSLEDFLQDHFVPGFDVLSISRIELTEKGRKASVTHPLVGLYVIEENFGAPHPFLVMPKEMIKPRPAGERELFPLNIPRQPRPRGRI